MPGVIIVSHVMYVCICNNILYIYIYPAAFLLLIHPLVLWRQTKLLSMKLDLEIESNSFEHWHLGYVNRIAMIIMNYGSVQPGNLLQFTSQLVFGNSEAS